ncbi:ketopantoate reductase family protein [Kerstersia sp.]|uniref:ketopantoate reductase family protein n=1 Tax=Kerstersia sp. TaxID=1930783 RepID=UPI003F90F771
MKITILGAGAMGALFGGQLAEAGHDVTLLDVDNARIQAIQADGLVLETGSGRRTVRLPIMRPEAASGAPDWLLVFTKSVHTDAALAGVSHLIGPQTYLLSLQNGLGNAEKLAQVVEAGRVAHGMTTVPADVTAPGVVRSHGRGYVRFMMADGSANSSLEALAEAMRGAGLDCNVAPDVLVDIWEKVAFNAAMNSMCALAGCPVDGLAALPEGVALVHETAAEVLAVARALDVAVNEPRVAALMDHAMAHHTGHQPSMLQDRLAGRPTEIDAINGAVCRAARKLDVPVPRNETLWTLMRLADQHTVVTKAAAKKPAAQA